MTTERCDSYVHDILDMSEPPESTEKSEIIPFFDQANILVTGGTGFLGKLLVEKLLRCCPNISKLYLVVRPKKEKSSSERIKENFDDIIYDRLKKEQPNFLSKVVLVEGDGSKPEFGWSPEIKQMLMNINIIFHAAALVRFEAKLRVITATNVQTVKFLLTFVKQIPSFKAFVHVSTAYAHCTRDFIDEKHYSDTIDADKLVSLLDILDDDMVTRTTPILLNKWPNTYVFTKAIGENAVLKYSNDLPVCIVRPAIVTSTYTEPISGWTNNLYGATGVVLGAGLGLLHTLHCCKEKVADIIPADYVVATIIAAAWDVGTRKRPIKASPDSIIPDEEKVPIYNSVSSCQNPITWGEFMKKNEDYAFEVPSKKVVWYYALILNNYLFMHNICAFLFHLVPAVIVDTAAYLTGRKPILMDAYRKIHKFSNVIHYFSTREWNFRNENVLKLWNKMNCVDRENFFFDIGKLDWDAYFYIHVRGLRVFMLNDPLDTLDESRVAYSRLRKIHYTLLTSMILLSLWILYSFISYLWSFCPLAH
nr:fatty acyl-CoA reductase wat-like [Osmia lignaria]